MKKPLVAIVGRPNVGKSTFFNKIAGKRISIVKDEPGVTRDRIYADAEWQNHAFSMVDTGGIDIKNTDKIQRNIMNQAQIAIELADVILLFVDGKEGLTAADREVANFLRKSRKEVIVVVNKLDNFDVSLSYDFYELGFGEPCPISSEQSKGLGDLLDRMIDAFENKVMIKDDEPDVIKIAIVGKPNAGKSSITNKILGEERVVVSSVAGTTRDAIDTPFTYDGQKYILIDTAGMRRKRGIEYKSVEQYSVLRALEAVRRADVVLVVLDSTEEISEQDVRIAGYVHEQGKPSLIVMNKWDLIEKDTHTMKKYQDKLDLDLAFMKYFVPVYVSALTGQRVNKIMPLVNEVYENSERRIKTSVLNQILQDAVSITPPPARKGRRLKVLYATQNSSRPPHFIIFVNDGKLLHFSYERYLENCFRRSLKLKGAPIRITFKSKKDELMGD